MAQTERRGRGRPRSTSGDAPATTVQALDRGMGVLAALSRFGRATLTDLSVTTEIAPSTAHRLLETLRRHGVVEFDEADQTWAVGVEAFRIGSTYLLRANYIDAGRQMMRRMVERTGETANLGVPDSGDIVFVSQVETQQPIRAFFPPGTRGHMHASGIGKALLAEMSPERVAGIVQRPAGVHRQHDHQPGRADGRSGGDPRARLGGRRRGTPAWDAVPGRPDFQRVPGDRRRHLDLGSGGAAAGRQAGGIRAVGPRLRRRGHAPDRRDAAMTPVRPGGLAAARPGYAHGANFLR